MKRANKLPPYLTVGEFLTFFEHMAKMAPNAPVLLGECRCGSYVLGINMSGSVSITCPGCGGETTNVRPMMRKK